MTLTDIDSSLISSTSSMTAFTITVSGLGAATDSQAAQAAAGDYIPKSYWSALRTFAIKHRESPGLKGKSVGEMILKAMSDIAAGLTP